MTETNKKENQPHQHKTEKQQNDKQDAVAPTFTGLLFGLIIIVAILLAGAGFYGWKQLVVINDYMSGSSADIRTVEQKLNSEQQAIQQITQTQKTVQEKINIFEQELGNDKAGRAVAEAAYLIHLADYRLRFLRDTKTAVAMLKESDNIARKAELTDLRAALSNDITAIGGLDAVDVSGMALALTSMSDSVEKLVLKKQIKAAPVADSGSETKDTVSDWQGFLMAVLDNLRQLVVIRRSETGAEPLLAPQEQYFLYQNLRLKLESTRLAMLRSDTAAFQASLNSAQAWLKQYFDQDAPTVVNALQTLESMQGKDLSPALPVLQSVEIIQTIRGAAQ